MQWPPVILRMETKVYCDPFYTLASASLTPPLPMVTALSTVLRVDCGGQMWKGTVIKRLYNKFLHVTVTHSSTLCFMTLGLAMWAGLRRTVLLLQFGIPCESGHQ